jgi:hypothetical protein
MKHRGRKSAAELSVIQLAERALPPAPELEPPPELSESAAEIWTGVVRARPKQFNGFELRTLLAAYACHAVTTAELSKAIAKVDTSDLVKLNKLLAMRARESQATLRLAARLRLLPKVETSTPWPAPWAK